MNTETRIMGRAGSWYRGLAVGILFLSLACGDGTTDPGASDATLTEEEAGLVADEVDRLAGLVVGEEMAVVGAVSPRPESSGASASLVPHSREFSRTHSCPGGGTVSIEGSFEHDFDEETETLSATFQATTTLDECVIARRGGTLTLTGELVLTATRTRVRGEHRGTQETTLSGVIDWVRDTGESGSCVIEVTSVRDAETRGRTVTGTVCGEPVDRHVGWNPGSVG